MRPLLLYAIGAVLALACRSTAHAQRLETRLVSASAADQRATAASDSAVHLTGRRIAAAFGAGFGTGYAALHVDWVRGGLIGYFAGVVVGGALVGAKNCGFAERLNLSLVGGLAGAVVSYFVAGHTYLARDVEAVAATIVVGGAPIAGMVITLRHCD